MPTISDSNSVKLEDNNSDNELSFLDRIKIFLGIKGEVEDSSATSTITLIEQNDDNTLEEVVTPVADLPVNADIVEDSTAELKLPSGFDEDDDGLEKAEMPTADLPVSANIVEELKLPTGFAEDDDGLEKAEMPTVDLPVSANIVEDSVEELKLPSGFDEDDDGLEQENTNKKVTIIKDNKKAKIELPDENNSSFLGDNASDVPNYVDEIDLDKNLKTNISQYEEELQSKYLDLKPVNSNEVISADNYIDGPMAVTSQNVDELQLQFIHNEAQVLLLSNDDVVLGRLTENAQIDLMDFRSYTKNFWKNYNKIKNESESYVIDQFINDYDKNFNKEDKLYNESELIAKLNEAFKAIDNNINSLISILNNYPILQLTGEKKNTLLHEAAYVDNYSAAKLLILKGINVFARNIDDKTALNIAEKFNNQKIVFLLKSVKNK